MGNKQNMIILENDLIKNYKKNNPHLTEKEINDIYKVFIDLNPNEEGFINKDSITNYYLNSNQSDYFFRFYNKEILFL